MDKIIFATSNSHKIEEVSRINRSIEFLSLEDVHVYDDIPETGDTFKKNAYQKASFVYSRCHLPTLAEDSGLEVEVLYGEPGVLSARYAGIDKNHQRNMQKVLTLLGDETKRQAQFVSTLCFIDAKGRDHYFEGFCRGRIHTHVQGNGGFGYDPIFIPTDYDCTFGELPHEVKDAISHRKQSFALFASFLNQKIK
jgi:XTP/dITP diphosphohydrolase